MSVVEKAADKLRALASAPATAHEPQPAPVTDDVMQAQTAPTLERLQERIHVAESAAADAPQPLHVDAAMLRRHGLWPADEQAQWRLTQELRHIKRPLLDNVAGKGAQVLQSATRIMVASAVPGEGKTFTAVNLAFSLARERDLEVVLVDADVLKPDVTRVLGLEEFPGLTDVLADEQRHPADIIVRTDVPNLLVVPAGKRHALAAELFGSRRMELVLAGLDERGPRRRVFVFDSSPLLAAADSQVLLNHVGQVLVVVAAGQTRQQDVKQALASPGPSQYVGLILNMSRLSESEDHYHGYYSRYCATDE